MERNHSIDAELFQVYVVESTELLERFNQSILMLEKDPDRTDILNELFRIAHNLKGASGMVGYDDIKESMHAAEDLLDGARSGKLTLNAEHFDLLLALSDTVYECIKNPNSEFTKDDWVGRLRGSLRRDQGEQTGLINPPLLLNAEQKKEIGLLQEQGKVVYGFEMEFAVDAQFRSVTSMLFINQLNELGQVFISAPNNDELCSENYSHFKTVCVCEHELGEDVLEKLRNRQPSSHSVVDINWRKWVYHPIENKPEEHEVEKITDTIRVNSLKLQKLLNTVGDLLSDQAGLNDAIELKGGSPEQAIKVIKSQMYHFNQTVASLQSEIMQLRMVPIKQLFTRFPRIVRDLAHKKGKEINLVTQGESTEIDKIVLELLVDPLTHLIRNAVDHGIEDTETRKANGKNPFGTVTLLATQEGNNIVVEVSDDGKGINTEKVLAKALKVGVAHEDKEYKNAEIINFIFEPGFSTAETITDVSGRGVGLDVVRNNLAQVSGTVSIQTEVGKGTTFRLSMPLTLAIINAFLVKIDEQTYVLPSHDVVENITIYPKDLHRVEGVDFIRLRDDIIPLRYAKEIFNGNFNTIIDRQPVVVVGDRNRKVGLVVDEFIEHREIMIKPFNASLEMVDYISGVTILGNGQVCLIIDTSSLLNLAS